MIREITRKADPGAKFRTKSTFSGALQTNLKLLLRGEESQTNFIELVQFLNTIQQRGAPNAEEYEGAPKLLRAIMIIVHSYTFLRMANKMLTQLLRKLMVILLLREALL